MPSRANLPSVTRILLPVLLFQSLIGLVIRYHHSASPSEVVIAWLVFLPSHSLRYPWTLITTTLVENNLVTLAIATSTIFYGGRYLERAWTSIEFVKFLLVVSLIPNILCYGLLSFFFALTGNSHWISNSTPTNFLVQTSRNIIIHGTLSLQISFLVAFSQLVPTHTVTIFKGIISVRVTRVPLLHFAGISLLALTRLLSAASLFLVTFGFLSSWTYLRFFKQAFPDLQSDQASLRGDASEWFAFSEFFPEFIKPLVSAISDKVYDGLVMLQICPSVSVTSTNTSRGDLLMQRGTPGSARAEAERRRAVALKALDQRLHAATAGYSKANHPPPSTSAGPSTQIESQTNESESGGLQGEIIYGAERRPDEDKTVNSVII